MWPVESMFQRQDRYDLLLKNLKNLKAKFQRPDTLIMIALQELNPVGSRCDSLKKALVFDGDYTRINHGLRFGFLSYPLFLDEGLGSLCSPNLKNIKIEHHLLSGFSLGNRNSHFFPVCMSLAECRGAIFISGEFASKKFLFVNVHLHHVKKEVGGADRRIREIRGLLALLKEKKKDHDAIFIMGDLNCEINEEEILLFNEEGFLAPYTKDESTNLCTWDPRRNPYAHLDTTMHTDPDLIEWTRIPRQLDHILQWGELKAQNTSIKLAFDSSEEICSDHYGLYLQCEF
jgi:endonuclease/exonuclease/phosphatase family metal-dependent hydrolase